MIHKESEMMEFKKSTAELKSGPRKEIPEIPVEAIREAVGNSLCHRDYSNPKGNEVAIFKDRIEIYNPGKFPEELDPEDFIKGKGHSILRNPLIAETMFLSEDIEKWASGIKRIYEECQKYHIKVDFNREKTGFVVVFHRPKWEDGEGLEDRDQKTREKTREKILRLIKENPGITTAELAEKSSVSPKGVEWNIAKLKKEGFIKRVGPDKGGYWGVPGE